MNLAGHISYRAIAVTLALGALAPGLQAHGPFDCTARVIVHDASMEAAVTAGSSLGESFLRAANIDPRRLPLGHPFGLDIGLAARFFGVADDAKELQPREAEVTTDGLEFTFRFEYGTAPEKSLRVRALFVSSAAAPRQTPLVLTDENGNILGSTILSAAKDTAEFKLPKQPLAQSGAEPAVKVSATNAPLERSIAQSPRASSKEVLLRRALAAILAVIILVVLFWAWRRKSG
jgi:hypothetical protein